jgi:hypothetical protein
MAQVLEDLSQADLAVDGALPDGPVVEPLGHPDTPGVGPRGRR